MTDEPIDELLERAEEAAVRELARRILDEPDELRSHELIRAAELLRRRNPPEAKPPERKPTRPNLTGLPASRVTELSGKQATVTEES